LEKFLEDTSAISHEIIRNNRRIVEERHRRRWRLGNTSVAWEPFCNYTACLGPIISIALDLET
jgi:hypothetical protein